MSVVARNREDQYLVGQNRYQKTAWFIPEILDQPNQLPRVDAATLGREIVDKAFAYARAEMRKQHLFTPGECYGDLCICAEPKKIKE